MLNDIDRSEIKQSAKEAAVHTEQFCTNCRETTVDPLGTAHGVTTPSNKRINQLTDEIIQREGLDPMCQQDIRTELVETFFEFFEEFTQEKEVDSHVECFYCFELKDGTDHIPLIVWDDPTDSLTDSRQEWR
jgi:hypothetical protein